MIVQMDGWMYVPMPVLDGWMYTLHMYIVCNVSNVCIIEFIYKCLYIKECSVGCR